MCAPGASARGVLLETEIGLGKRSASALAKRGRTAKESIALLRDRSDPERFELGRPRYAVSGLHLSTRTWWSDSEKAALRAFCDRGSDIHKVSDALGRSPTSIVSYAKDSGLAPSFQWRSILPMAKKIIRAGNVSDAALLQFPYIVKPRDEHSELLAANALIPKSIPPHMRADIVQEIMLALLEGRVTIDDLKAKQANVRWFVTKFYRENFEQAGHALSLTAEHDGDEYDRIDASVSQDEWRIEQINEKRRAWEAIDNRFYAPSQIDDIYHHQVRNEQRRLHMKDDLYLDYFDAENELKNLDPKSMRHMDISALHNHDRLFERYGIRWTTAINREMRAAISEGRVSGAKRAHSDDDAMVGWIRVQGRNVRVVYDQDRATIITVIPPTDEGRGKTYREQAREKAEAYFK